MTIYYKLYTGKCLEGFYLENLENNELRFYNLSPVYKYITWVFKDLSARMRYNITILSKGQIILYP